MLVVTTTVRVINRVHSHTTSTGPRVALDSELVVSTTSLQERLVNATTAGDNADGGTGLARNGLLGTRWETDTAGVALGIVTDDGGVVARGTGERTTVTGLLLDVAHDGTLRELRDGENVANVQDGALAAVDKLAGGETLSCDESLGAHLVAVRVTESDAGERSTTVGSKSSALSAL